MVCNRKLIRSEFLSVPLIHFYWLILIKENHILIKQNMLRIENLEDSNKFIVEKLINKGNVERGWLGAGIQGLNPELAILFKIPRGFNEGILINTVKDHTPAKNGGMKRGDIIIQYDGKQILNTRIFKNLVANTKVGKKVPINIIRNGNEKLLLVTIGKLINATRTSIETSINFIFKKF